MKINVFSTTKIDGCIPLTDIKDIAPGDRVFYQLSGITENQVYSLTHNLEDRPDGHQLFREVEHIEHIDKHVDLQGHNFMILKAPKDDSRVEFLLNRLKQREEGRAEWQKEADQMILDELHKTAK